MRDVIDRVKIRYNVIVTFALGLACQPFENIFVAGNACYTYIVRMYRISRGVIFSSTFMTFSFFFTANLKLNLRQYFRMICDERLLHLLLWYSFSFHYSFIILLKPEEDDDLFDKSTRTSKRNFIKSVSTNLMIHNIIRNLKDWQLLCQSRESAIREVENSTFQIGSVRKTCSICCFI